MFAFQSVKWAEVVDRIEHRGGKKKIVLGRQEEYFWVKKISHSKSRDFCCIEEKPCLLGEELHRGKFGGRRKDDLVKCKILHWNERVFCPGHVLQPLGGIHCERLFQTSAELCSGLKTWYGGGVWLPLSCGCLGRLGTHTFVIWV